MWKSEYIWKNNKYSIIKSIMKKCLYLVVLVIGALILPSCEVGRYMPRSINMFGAQTQVVLSQANFRVVRDIELVVEVNNSHINRAETEKSAFAALMRKYPLVGSQAYTNVVIEEVRRESDSANGSTTELKQYISARATIIEFLKEDGSPVAP